MPSRGGGSTAGGSLDVTTIRKLAGLPRTTAYRLLAVLRNGGLIRGTGAGDAIAARHKPVPV